MTIMELLQFGKRRKRAAFGVAFQLRFGRSLESLAPTTLPGEVVTEGDPNHKHKLYEVPWDRARLGSSFCDVDEAEHAKPGIAFPLATFKDLYRCSCGREVVRSIRALL